MLKKASKRLITAIISLVVSVILCVGVCLAWFAVNNKVGGDGMNSQLRRDDLISFTITPYFLNETSADSTVPATYATAADGNNDANGDPIKDGGKAIAVDNNNDGVIDGSDTMRPFSLSGAYTTAVLFKLEYEIAADSEKSFRIFAECPCPLPETIPDPKPDNDAITRLAVANDGSDAFKSKLSNAVTFTKASATVGENGVPTACTESKEEGADRVTHTPFVDQNHEKSFKLSFFDGITVKDDKVADGVYKDASYLIMDYDSERFTYLSSLMLENGGSLSSHLSLIGDINFVMEEYDQLNPETVTVDSVALDTLAPNAVYEQNATKENNDIMSKTWQFVVTYSDGGKKIVKANVDHTGELVIGNINTTTAGTDTVAVKYTEAGSDEVTCSVNYTINLAVSGNTSVAKADELKLSLVGLPSGATVNWESSNTAIATVSDSGVVTGVAAGEVTITATSSDGKYTAVYTVTVVGEKVAVSGVTLDKSTLSLTVGATSSLKATVAPENATDKTVSWTTSASGVATVSDSGTVTAVAAGTATITVTTTDGSFTATCTVTVTEQSTTVAVTGVELDKSSLSLTEDETATLKATVKPTDATNKSVTWKSDNESIATVDKGVVTAVAAGTTTITVTTADGSFTATCTVTVKAVTPTEYTTGKHTLDIANGVNNATNDIFTSTKASSDGGYNTGFYKFGTGDYLDITVKLKAGQTLTVRGTGIQSNTSRSVTLGMSVLTAESTGSFIDQSQYTKEFSGTSEATFERVYTVENEGEIVLRLERTTTTTGCNITALSVIVDEVVTPVTEYTVTFDANGHGTAPTAQTVAEGGKATKPADLTANGYKFGGWYKEDTCKNAFDFNTKITADRTLYAKWTIEEYTITYALDGGTNNANNPTSYTIETSTITLKEPTKDGYKFEGWKNASGVTVTEITKGSTGNITLTATWTVIKYKITYAGVDGITGTNSNPTEYTIESDTITLADVTKDNFTFNGWKNESGSIVTEIAKGSTGNITLTAQWTPNGGTDEKVKEYVVNTNLTAATNDGIINMAAGNKSSYDNETGNWSGTINGVNKTYTAALRPSGGERAISIKIEEANTTVYVAFGLNKAGGKTTNSIWLGNSKVTTQADALKTETAVKGTTTENGLLTYTFTATGTYYILFDSDKPYIYGITLVKP